MDWLRILIISLILLLVIFYFANGYFLLYCINFILYPFASGPAYLPTKMKWCKELRENYTVIRDEYINYSRQNKLKSFRDIDPNQKTTDTGDIPWEILMLRVYKKDTNKIKHFPKTYHLSLIVPDAPKNESQGCFIKVNDENHYWQDGLDVMFDDTYTNSAPRLNM